MRIRNALLGALGAAGLFAFAGSAAKADHWHRAPVHHHHHAPVYRPVAPVYSLPTYGYGYRGFNNFGYGGYGGYNSFYNSPGFGFGYSRGYYAPSYGWSYYGRPGVSFGFNFR